MVFSFSNLHTYFATSLKRHSGRLLYFRISFVRSFVRSPVRPFFHCECATTAQPSTSDSLPNLPPTTTQQVIVVSTLRWRLEKFQHIHFGSCSFGPAHRITTRLIAPHRAFSRMSSIDTNADRDILDQTRRKLFASLRRLSIDRTFGSILRAKR